MPGGTKTRPFLRLLDASAAPFWVISPAGQLVYLSTGCARWLKVPVEELVNRRAIAGAPVSDDPLDHIAAALSPPPGLASQGTASMRVQPPAAAVDRPAAMEVRFVRVGQSDTAITVGIAGSFDDRHFDAERSDAVAIRQKLDQWRHLSAASATVAAAGTSAAIRRLRRRLKVASQARSDLAFVGRRGNASEALAMHVHQLATSHEPIVSVDGPLMDAELLDASLMPLIHRLTDSDQSLGTVLVRQLDEMSVEAQLQLSHLLETFDGRLRLIALCGPTPRVLQGGTTDSQDDRSSPTEEVLWLHDQPVSGICDKLAEVVSTLVIEVPTLAERVEDIPIVAQALLDSIHAERKTPAERWSRAALDALVIYPWPGDFQELQEAVRHAATVARGEAIATEHLPLAVRSFRPGQGSARPRVLPTSLDDAVRRYERRLIEQAVELADGNRAEAARQLGISRARLLRKLEADQ